MNTEQHTCENEHMNVCEIICLSERGRVRVHTAEKIHIKPCEHDRCKPENSEYCMYELGGYVIYRDGVIVNRYAEPSPMVKLRAEQVALERGFVCAEDELEDSVKYMVLETKDGELVLGDYIGD